MKERNKNRRKVGDPTYRQIATVVERSPMHVWRVINGKGQFSKVTEEKVKKAIAEFKKAA